MSDELLPCPHCGGTNIKVEGPIYLYGSIIGCDDCSASVCVMERPPLNAERMARELWNRRTPPTPTLKE